MSQQVIYVNAFDLVLALHLVTIMNYYVVKHINLNDNNSCINK